VTDVWRDFFATNVKVVQDETVRTFSIISFNQRDLRHVLSEAIPADADINDYVLTIYRDETRSLLGGLSINIMSNADSIDEYGYNHIVYIPIEIRSLDC